MALSVVQDNTGTSGTTSVTATFNSTPARSNLMVGCIFTRATSITNPTNWNTAIEVLNTTENDALRISYKVVTDDAAGVTFTVNVNDASSLGIFEVSGNDTATPLDKTASTGRTTAVTSISSGTTAALAQADEICFAVAGIRGAISTPSMSNSYTFVHEIETAADSSSATVLDGYRIVTATDAQSTTISWASPTATAMGAIATFRAKQLLTIFTKSLRPRAFGPGLAR